jgi:ankyrin repeat protein
MNPDINIRNKGGLTPLMIALKYQTENIINRIRELEKPIGKAN